MNKLDFLEYEASIVEEWSPEFQSLIDKGLVKVIYDGADKAHFYLTDLGESVVREINVNIN